MINAKQADRLLKAIKQMLELAKQEGEQKFHIHIRGSRITHKPLSHTEIKKVTGKTAQELERHPDIKLVPHPS
jgi:hypothetical protein